MLLEIPVSNKLLHVSYSSLREVYLTRQLNKTAKDLQYYYMGFYIHSCPKMRYKARLNPSKLLCPKTYEWFDIDACIKKLDKEKYCTFNEDFDAIDQDAIVDINKVTKKKSKKKIMYSPLCMNYL